MTDQAEIIRTLETFLEPGQMTEVRIIYNKTDIRGGWYAREDASLVAEHVAALPPAPGIYFIPNPINPTAISKPLRTIGKLKTGEGTDDGWILCRRWLLVDFDPRRSAGISSTDEEKATAWEACQQANAALLAEGFTPPIMADSGNGYHLCFRLDAECNDRSREDARDLLYWLKARFENEQVKMDTSVYNAARIWKLYGTMARKGEQTAERPHRLSRLLEVPS